MSRYNASPPYQASDSISPSAIPLSAIKALELRFQHKGFLPAIQEEEMHPVWFRAIKARDRFLWRKGLSLGDEEAFVFWVDIHALLSERIVELQDHEQGLAELEYLRSFLDAYFKIFRHVHALSRANLALEEEIHPERAAREVVVLPERTQPAKTIADEQDKPPL